MAEYVVSKIQDNITGNSYKLKDINADDYAPKKNPEFKNSISLGRKEDTDVGVNSVAEGTNVTASGSYSHAEGSNTVANGIASHTEGWNTVSTHFAQHVSGSFNVPDPSGSGPASMGTYAEIIGNGRSEDARSNARVLDWNGNERLKGDLYVGCNPDSSGGNKVAILDASGKVVTSQLPSYVDDVLEFDSKDFSNWPEWVSGASYSVGDRVKKIANNVAAGYICKKDNSSASFVREEWNDATCFPAVGEDGKIYIAIDANVTYRWGGSAYSEVGSSLALGETEYTAYRGDRGAAAYAAAVTNVEHSPSQDSDNLITSGAVYEGLEERAPKANPVFTGSISLGRIDGTPVGENSVAVGTGEIASGVSSFAEGMMTRATGQASHAEGKYTYANGANSHAEGLGYSFDSTAYGALGKADHSEGYQTTANSGTGSSSYGAHAEGYQTTAADSSAHAEGYKTSAATMAAHAEGRETIALGTYSHSEGRGTIASGTNSHAEGDNTVASGISSHAEGTYTKALGPYQHVSGKYNAGISSGSIVIPALADVEEYDPTKDFYPQGSVVKVDDVIYVAHDNANVKRSSPKYDKNNWRSVDSVPSGTTPEEWDTNTAYEANTYVKVTDTDGTEAYFRCIASMTAPYIVPGVATEGVASWHSQPEGSVYDGFPIAMEIVGNGVPNTEGRNIRVLDANGNEYLAGEVYVKCNADGTGGTKLTTTEDLDEYVVKNNAVITGSISMGRNAGTVIGANSVAVGGNLTASGAQSHAEGGGTTASGENSHAEGGGTTASGGSAHAEGGGTKASGGSAHAEGGGTTASGSSSHAEGGGTTASGDSSHAEGGATTASGFNSHAEGSSTTASGNNSHSEGSMTFAQLDSEHVSGKFNTKYNEWAASTAYSVNDIVVNNSSLYKCKTAHTSGTTFDSTKWNDITNDSPIFVVGNGTKETDRNNAFIVHRNGAVAEGYQTIASGGSSHAEGLRSTASGYSSHTEGESTKALGGSSHAEGLRSTASGGSSHAEGGWTTASGGCSHAEGSSVVASGDNSHAEGLSTVAIGHEAHSEGERTTATGYCAHVEGYGDRSSTKVINSTTYTGSGAHGSYAHSEGSRTWAIAESSHAEGSGTVASGYSSHAEGNSTTTSSSYSHAEGVGTNASNYSAHAEGSYTTSSGDSAHSEGQGSTSETKTIGSTLYTGTGARGTGSHAEGYHTWAIGSYSHAEGNSTTASSYTSHSEGNTTNALADASHAEGYYTTVSAVRSHAEGDTTTASGRYGSHSEGSHTTASGESAHSEGYYTTASGMYSHAEGESSSQTKTYNGNTYYYKANGQASHVEGSLTIANGYGAHAEGAQTMALSHYTHAEGQSTVASSQSAHAEGFSTSASGYQSHAEGDTTTSSGYNSHAEGTHTVSSNSSAHAEGHYTNASGAYSHAEGYYVKASNSASHAEGYGDNTLQKTFESSTYTGTGAHGNASHAEGYKTWAIGGYSHAEGNVTTAAGGMSHTEGDSTTASAESSHAEGKGSSSYTKTINSRTYSGTGAHGNASHAEGWYTWAIGRGSHSEGDNTTASGLYSHAEGSYSVASGDYSHVEGCSTLAAGRYSHIVGKYNVEDSFANWPEWVADTSYKVGDKVKRTDGTTVTGYICTIENNDSTFRISNWNGTDVPMNYAEIVGNGVNNARSNARALDWDGNEYLKGNIYVGCNANSTGGTKLEPLPAVTSADNNKVLTVVDGAWTAAEGSSGGSSTLVKIPFSIAVADWTESSGVYTASFVDSNITSTSEEFVIYSNSIKTNLVRDLDANKDATNHAMVFTTDALPAGPIAGNIFCIENTDGSTGVVLVNNNLPVSKGGTGATTAAQALTNLGAVPASEKGAASGIATLDSTGKVSANQLPFPAPPTTDGNYVLQASVVSGVPTYSWVAL